MPRMSRILNTTLKVAYIAACAVVVVNGSLDVYAWIRQRASTPQRAAVNSFRPGMKAPAISGVDFASETRTLLLFVSTNCIHCQRSAPFYARLADTAGAARPSGAKLRVVAVFPQAADEVDMFKNRMKLNVETITGARFDALGVHATPTVLLVGQDGAIVRAWMRTEESYVQDSIYSAFVSGGV